MNAESPRNEYMLLIGLQNSLCGDSLTSYGSTELRDVCVQISNSQISFHPSCFLPKKTNKKKKKHATPGTLIWTFHTQILF